MKRSIFFKLLFGFSLIVIVLAGLILLFAYQPMRNYFIGISFTQLERLAVSLEPSILPYIDNAHFRELDAFVKSTGQKIDTRITVMNPDGVVIADSENDINTMENHRFRIEMQKALAGETGTAIRYSPTEHRQMLYVAVPLRKQNKVLCVVRTSIPFHNIDELLRTMKRRVGWATCATVSIGILFAAFFFLGFSMPLRELVRASRRVTEGDLGVRVSLKRQDEFGKLADSFNEMTNRLHLFFNALSAKNEEFNSIISSIREGLLVFDGKGRILMANKSFNEIAGMDQVIGKHFYEVIRSPEFSDLAEKILDQKNAVTGEIIIRNRIYLCSAVYLHTDEKIVCLFHDITELRRLERVKKDFVANVSHELKTPLTAIKGFVETVMDSADKETQRHLEIVGRNTDRLIRIVDDLLTLSEMEEKGFVLDLAEVDIKEVLKNALSFFEQKARDKGLALVLNIMTEVPAIQADRYRLEQLFINLLDNAVKYTEHGSIHITVKTQEKVLVIEIEDTGIGISEEHLPRIFERFYVADKSRSRKSGGTGLGLAIAKHIVHLHNGTITVTSTSGQGTKFTVTLPISRFPSV